VSTEALAQARQPKLSICIATLNRAQFLLQTLESILPQMTSECEVVVLDGASTDDTQQVVTEATARSAQFRYVRLPVNSGIDRDYDHAVEHAHGEYCWLMTDDDLIKPGAIAAVLEAVSRNVSLVLVNAEIRNVDLSTVLRGRWLDIDTDQHYGAQEMDRLWLETANILRFIGCVVINRELWRARKRHTYYGSLYIHIGVIFQAPLPRGTLVLSHPLITYRMGNTHSYSPKVAEITFSKWPSLVRSLNVSEVAKRQVIGAEPWNNYAELLQLRGLGHYTFRAYRHWIHPLDLPLLAKLTPMLIAVIPGMLVNAALVLFYSASREGQQMNLQAMRQSPFYMGNWRVFRYTS
jgi:glycosyltransferase involved in cell wall biosynthesis